MFSNTYLDANCWPKFPLFFSEVFNCKWTTVVRNFLVMLSWAINALTNDDPVNWRIYSSPRINTLNMLSPENMKMHFINHPNTKFRVIGKVFRIRNTSEYVMVTGIKFIIEWCTIAHIIDADHYWLIPWMQKQIITQNYISHSFFVITANWKTKSKGGMIFFPFLNSYNLIKNTSKYKRQYAQQTVKLIASWCSVVIS